MDQIPPGLDLCLFPAGMPPNGTVPNFEDPETLVAVLISICVIMMVGSVFFTACRLFANRQKLWWSDYCVTIALILTLAHTGLMLDQTKFARHQWDVRACWYDGRYTRLLFSQEILLSFVLFFSKASIFLLFHQIFQVERYMRIAIRFGIIFSALLYFTSIPLSAILSAPHVGETWASVLLTGRPQKELLWGVVQSALGVLLDAFIFILPIPIILKLNMSKKKKIQVLAVFTTALVGVIASILSLVYRAEAIGTNDGTWKYTSLLICSVVESAVAIIVSNTPGFANFTKVYISELNRGTSGYENKRDPNRPRTGKELRKRENREFDGITDALRSASSNESGEGANSMSLLPASNFPGIIQTVGVAQETHYPDSTPAAEVQEPEMHDYLSGVYHHEPGAIQPLA